jgi:Carboxypeptidase regulatory-like domain
VRSTRVSKFVLGLIGCCAFLALPAAASAGSLSGTVTAAVGGGPVGGIEVCVTPEPYGFEVPCTETNGSGGYQLPNLRESAYRLRFSSARNNLNYVDQFYDGKLTYPGDTLFVGLNEAKTVDAALQPGGTIAGTVADANTHAPIAGLQVCAAPTSITAGIDRCWRTDGNGSYQINGLSTAEYRVQFFGEGAFNYLTQHYDGVDGAGSATLVPIAGPNQVVSSIDAAMQPGAEISGRLTEAGSDKPLANVSVSLLYASTGEAARSVETDAAGNYAFRGRPAGNYIVGFSHTNGGPWNNDCYAAQYYKGSASLAGASPLTVAPPQVLTGIDGQVSDLCPDRVIQPIKVELIPTPPQPPVLKCRKAQKKKWVKGRYRCVKKPRKHRKHHRRGAGRGGPHAVATDR